MLESAVGAVGYVIRKLNQVPESGHTTQSRVEAIEIIEAAILALVAVVVFIILACLLLCLPLWQLLTLPRI